jgi:hypothetical protein
MGHEARNMEHGARDTKHGPQRAHGASHGPPQEPRLETWAITIPTTNDRQLGIEQLHQLLA